MNAVNFKPGARLGTKIDSVQIVSMRVRACVRACACVYMHVCVCETQYLGKHSYIIVTLAHWEYFYSSKFSYSTRSLFSLYAWLYV